MKIPPFSGLRAFEAVTRLGSIRGAARELNLDHSVVSRQLRELQLRLGVELVETTRGGIKLKPEGQIYARAVSAALNDLATATGALSNRSRPLRPLVIMSAPAFASKWLMPHLGEFRARHPGIEIILKPTGSLDQDLGNFDADVLIRLCNPDEIGGHPAAPIARPRIFPVASRRWLDANPHIQKPADIAGAPLIHERSLARWETWLQACGVQPTRPLSGPHIEQAHLVMDAVRQGYGVGLSNALISDGDVGVGDVVEIGSTNVVMEQYVLIVSRNSQAQSSINSFRNWLIEAVGVTMEEHRQRYQTAPRCASRAAP